MDHYPSWRKRDCRLCGDGHLLSSSLPFCPDCLRTRWTEVEGEVLRVHRRSRAPFGLPERPPREGAVECPFCVNRCRIPEGGRGYCGAKTVEGGKLVHSFGHDRGLLSYYYDPLPTNCVAAFACGGCARSGFPAHVKCVAGERGAKNLAVFFRSCTLNCLSCQNSTFKERVTPAYTTPGELAALADGTTACICFFGGDPASQMTFSIKAARLTVGRRQGRPLRICWETNGSENPKILHQAARLALGSGGTIKVDVKAWSRGLHLALTGSPNDWIRENLKTVGALAQKRPRPPLLVVSTLLVPGYVDEGEVGAIAGFLASLDPSIPYSLLAFHPAFLMGDLPPTSRRHAVAAAAAAQEAGLRRIHIGNAHLLW